MTNPALRTLPRAPCAHCGKRPRSLESDRCYRCKDAARKRAEGQAIRDVLRALGGIERARELALLYPPPPPPVVVRTPRRRSPLLPPTNPGALCTRCNEKPQSRVQQAKRDLYPVEQLSMCGECRGQVRTLARNEARRASVPARPVGAIHCATPGCRVRLGSDLAYCSDCIRQGVYARAS